MFWKKRRKPDKQRFQHYVAIGLSMNLPRIFEERAKQKNFPTLYRSLMELLASETFIMECMIGTCRSDIITGIYRQNGDDYEQSMGMARDGLSKMIAVGEQRGDQPQCTCFILCETRNEYLAKGCPSQSHIH